MKVYQINSVCGTGSTGKIVCDIKKALINNGDMCRIAYGRGNCSKENTYKFTNNFSNVLHLLFSRVFDKQGYYSKNATKRLINDIIDYSPDVIHLHNIHGYYLNFKMLFDFLKQSNIPVIWTLHDCWAFTGHCAYFDYVGCNKWQEKCFKCPLKKSYPASYLFDNSKNNFESKKQLFCGLDSLTLVTPSHWLSNIVSKSFLGKYPTEVIYNGIDLSVFKPTDGNLSKKYNLKGKKIILGVANIWEERKGLKDFISLSSKLTSEYVIVLVGLNKKQIKKLPDNIIGLTRTESVKELAEIYTLADVYINTSYEETMGLTTLEALATGTPAVVYDRTAVPEVIDKTCGIVTKAGDIQLLLKSIKCVNFNKESCIKRAEQFEKNKQYAKYLELYKKVLLK